MLNKYQQALTRVNANVIETLGFPKYEKTFKNDLNDLRYLVNKSVGKRAKRCHEDWGNEYYCPACEDLIDGAPTYCKECGQRLLWGEDE